MSIEKEILREEPSKRQNIEVVLIEGQKLEMQLSKLLDQAFDLPEGVHFLNDFPVWKEVYGAQTHRLGIKLDGKLVASASARISKMHLGKEKVKVGIIGAVATDKNHGRQGHASKLIDALCDWLAEEKTAAVFLWGSEHDFYRNLGFELCGVQGRCPISCLNLSAPAQISGKVEKGWSEELFSLVQNRKSGLVLEETDRSWHSAHNNVNWLTLRDNKNIKSYIAYGRGIDLAGIVHEWGGELEGVKVLLSQILKEHPESQIIGSSTKIKELEPKQEDLTLEYLCLAKVLDPKRVIQSIHPTFQFITSVDSHGWNLRVGDQHIQSLDSQEIVKILFGPEYFEEFLVPQFPIPIWFWGLDGA